MYSNNELNPNLSPQIDRSDDYSELIVPKIEKPKKILLTGTLDSGKTTLLQYLEMPKDCIGVKEVAREMLALDPSLEFKEEFQDLLVNEQFIREASIINHNLKCAFFDRGFLDILVYSELLHGRSSEVARINSLNYDLIILCDSEDIKVDVNDPLYVSGVEELRERIRVALVAKLEEINSEYIVVSGNTSQRIRLIAELIENKFGFREIALELKNIAEELNGS